MGLSPEFFSHGVISDKVRRMFVALNTCFVFGQKASRNFLVSNQS